MAAVPVLRLWLCAGSMQVLAGASHDLITAAAATHEPPRATGGVACTADGAHIYFTDCEEHVLYRLTVATAQVQAVVGIPPAERIKGKVNEFHIPYSNLWCLPQTPPHPTQSCTSLPHRRSSRRTPNRSVSLDSPLLLSHICLIFGGICVLCVVLE
jgi:hypothetical protein